MHNKSSINFIAIDFETTAYKKSSICEVDVIFWNISREQLQIYERTEVL
jgi:hypothetical protein